MVKKTVIALVGAVFFVSSCMSLDEEPKKKRGSLSEAMDKARDDNEGSRDVKPPPDSGEGNSVAESDSNDSKSVVEGAESSSSSGPSGIVIGLEGRYEFPFQDNIKEAYAFSVEAGTGIDKSVFLLRAGLEVLDLNSKGLYAKSMSGPIIGAFLGGDLRWSPFTIEEPFNPYFLLGYEQGILSWTYRNAIHSMGDTITSDSILTYTLNMGLGSNFIKLGGLNFFINGGFRFRLFGQDTQEGFKNDYFNGESYFYLSGDLLLKF